MSKQHARYSPSQLDNLNRCIRFKYWDKDKGSAGDEGTMLHECAEHGTVAGLTDEQARAVQDCLDYEKDLLAARNRPDLDLRETKVELENLTYGHPDRLLLWLPERELHVIDYKFTRVESEHDRQVTTYGAAAAEMLQAGKLDSTTEAVPLDGVTVHTHVLAPRLNKFNTATYNARILLANVRKEIESLYTRIDDPWEPETPDPEICARCARAASCPSMNSTAVAIARRTGLPLPSEFSPERSVAPRDRAIAFVLAKAMKAWAVQVMQHVNEWGTSNADLLPEFGLKLVTRSTGLRIRANKTGEAYGAMIDAGIPREIIDECVSIKLGELAQKYGETFALKQAEAKKKFAEILEDLAIESSTSFIQRTKRVSDAESLRMLNA